VRESPRDLRDLLEWFFITGMRPSEIARLRWEDLDGDTLRLAAVDAKTGHGRSVPVGDGALAAILKRRARAKNGPNIFHLHGRFATAGSGGFPKREYAIWRTAATAAGLPDARPYDLRRSAIRTLVRAGVSEHVTMAISGHRSRATLDRYNITDERDLRDAFRKVSTFKHGQRPGHAR
jgi:integrase